MKIKKAISERRESAEVYTICMIKMTSSDQSLIGKIHGKVLFLGNQCIIDIIKPVFILRGDHNDPNARVIKIEHERELITRAERFIAMDPLGLSRSFESPTGIITLSSRKEDEERFRTFEKQSLQSLRTAVPQ